ncbi:MAG: citrate:proton symporter [Lentimicrobiaceae bacterium]|jgi:CitMHS family citrate-Mg2+:H+ or citrate-Ca2+:H+ symporter
MSETMLAILGLGMITTFITLIMTKRLSPLVALTLIPILFGLISGAGSGLSKMMEDGLVATAPTGVLLMFGILYFGIMFEVGLFEPLIIKILQIAKGDPLKVIMGTCILAFIVALDGDGAATYLIIVGAMLPVYKRLGINPLILTAILTLCVGIMIKLPWTGANARCLSALHLNPTELFNPIIPSMVASIVWVLFVAYIFGKKERKRLGIIHIEVPENREIKNKKIYFTNLLLTIVLIVTLVSGLFPIAITFMVGLAIALIINFPNLEEQRKKLAAHAGSALSVGSMVFAAGIFTGILSGTKMLDAMAQSFIHIIPDSLGPNMGIITGLTSMPFTYFVSNDAYFYGIVPLTAVTASHFGVTAVEIGRASLLGQSVHMLSPLVASTYLLIGLAGVSFEAHQRFTLKWAVATTLVMLLVTVLTGAISFYL